MCIQISIYQILNLNFYERTGIDKSPTLQEG